MKWLINEWKKLEFLVSPTCHPIDKQLLCVRKLSAFGKKWVSIWISKHRTTQPIHQAQADDKDCFFLFFSFFFPKLSTPICSISHFTHLSSHNLTSNLLCNLESSYGVQFLGLKSSSYWPTFRCSSCHASFWYLCFFFFFSSFSLISSSGFLDFASIFYFMGLSSLDLAIKEKIWAFFFWWVGGWGVLGKGLLFLVTFWVVISFFSVNWAL